MSSWIDYVERSDESWEENETEHLIVTVCYTNQQGYTNGDLFFWATYSEYEALESASSQGSEYWHNWKEGGQEWYSNQDNGLMTMEEYDNYDEDDDADYNYGYSGSSGTYGSNNNSYTDMREDTSPKIESVDGNLVREMKQRKEDGSFDEWIEDLQVGEDKKSTLVKFADRIDSIEALLEKTEDIRQLVKLEKLTTRKMWKIIFRDVEEVFGISIEKRFKINILNQILPNKLNPNMFIKYKMKVKNFYEILEKEGIQGASKVGARWASARNPLIRNRYSYKGKEAIKGYYKKNYKGWYEGNEAVEQIIKFHRKTLKEEARGLMSRNSFKLEKRYVVRDGKKVMQVHWRRDMTIGRKVIVKSKKALRLAKWVAVI